MKKIFIIFCLVLSFLGILLTATPYFLRITGLDEPFKKKLIKKVFAEAEHKIDLQKIDIGLGNLKVSEISFISADKRIEIVIDEIIIDFNIIEFLKNISNPQGAISEVYISHPKLIVHQNPSISKSDPVSTQSGNLISILNELNNFKNLMIYDGEIFYKTVDGALFGYAQNLNGWLNSTSPDSIKINVVGSSFNSEEENFDLKIDMDNSINTYRSIIAVQNLNLDRTSFENFTDIYEVEAYLQADLEISGSITHFDSLLINGDLIITESSVFNVNDKIEHVNAHVTIKDNALSITDGLLSYKNHPLNITLKMNNIFEPDLSGDIKSVDLPIKIFNDIFDTHIFNGSTVNADFTFNISNDYYLFKGVLDSRSFSVYKSDFNYFNLVLKIDPDEFVINSFKMNNNDLHINGNAHFSNKSDIWKLYLNGEYASGEHLFFTNLTEARHCFDLMAVHNTKSKYSQGTWNYVLTGSDTLLNTHGTINSDSISTRIELADANYENFQARLKVLNIFQEPLIDYIEINNFPFEIFSSEKLFAQLSDYLDSRILLSGTFNKLKGRVELNESSSSDSLISITADIKNLFNKNTSISGEVHFMDMTGSYGADFNSTLLASHFFFEDGIFGELIIDILDPLEQINAEINIENFKVIQAIRKDLLGDYRYQGEANGTLAISGNLKSPVIKGDIRGNKFVINNVGYYQPSVNFTLDRTKLNIDSIKISHNNNQILQGTLNWALLTDQLTGYVEGDSLDLSTLLTAINLDTSLISGMANYKTIIQGTFNEPHLDNTIEIYDGQFDNILFDNLSLNIVDNIKSIYNSFETGSHQIQLNSLNMARQGYYHLNSIGNLPFFSEEPIDYVIYFDGDILNMVPNWEPYIQDGASLAEITMKLGGTKDDPKLLTFDASIERGELWLQDVAPHIENLSGKIQLEQGTNQVNMDLIAHVDDDYLKIRTVRDIKPASGRSIENWYFKGIDLDFGILEMETSSEGVRLHIPGVMMPSESGKIHLTGKTATEKFYFAGPVKHPLGYGLVTLNDAMITYPFIISKNTDIKKSKAVNFLSNIEWDAHLKAGEDVLYFRDIPAYFDYVYTEISVDERSPGIDFKGIINQGTFKPVGSMISTRGRLEYLDLNFKVERFTVDLKKNNNLPDVSGRAWTTLRDSVGAVPKTIFLQLYAIDEETGQVQQFGNWSDFKFKLVSADPDIGETQEQVLAYLGYSVENIGSKATNVGGALTDKYLIRPLLRPFERALEQSLGVDFVRFNSSIAKNLFYSSIGKQFDSQKTNPFLSPFTNDVPYLYLMSSSEVTVGKYLNENIYLTYTGQLVSVYDVSDTGYDMNHSFGVEYRFYKNILLEFEWDRELMGFYNFENQRQYLNDFKIRFRHSFSF